MLLVAIASSCSGGSGATPTPTPTVPATPTGLTAIAGNAHVSLSWSVSSGATSYNVYRSTTSGGEGSTAYQSGIAATSFTDNGVTNGTAYFYTVAAINNSGTSPQSSEVAATPSAGFIGSLSTDAARYAPGSTATIYVNLTNTTGASESGDVAINVTQLGSLQATLPAQAFSLVNGGTDTLTFTWVTPTTDFQGYSVEVTATNSANSVLGSMNSAIDVSSTWTKFPRYGYVGTYPDQATATSSGEIAQLNKYHINGIQFYDWQWKHHVPLAGTVASPAASWIQVDNETNYRQTVLDYITAAHTYGMSAMNYNLIYGAWAGYETDGSGVNSQWGLYQNSNGTDQVNINFTSIDWATPYIYVFDPGNTSWQNYIYGQEANVFAAYPFDGWHADQLGSTGYTYTGTLVTPNLPAEYASFLDGAKTALKKTIVFNAASGNGLPNVLADEDFAYVECWPSANGGTQNTYNDLKAVIDSINSSNPGQGVVLPAYMDYSYALNLGNSGQSGMFNTPGVLLTDAAIFASGASHLELGDGAGGSPGLDMLDNEYFPDEDLTPSTSLLNTLQVYYDFDVEYETLLRGGLTNNSNAISLNGVESSSSASADAVWAFAKNNDGIHMLNFINLIGEANVDWRDDSANYPVPSPQTNVAVRYYYGSGKIGSVFWASPDTNNGRMTSLSFTTGQDTVGSYVSFTLPSLVYWDMVYISPTSIAPSEADSGRN
ncbi:MAG: glycoside hydrolase family 66 protein [Terracidiphilus sp.]